MNSCRRLEKQQGFVLWMIVIALTLAGSYALYRTAHSRLAHARQESRLTDSLIRAKEALIARAASDANRPGSLPCPDLMTDSDGFKNFPDDGKADMLAGNHCPSYVGWLPWLTLDLPELTDDTGNHLWYALSPTLRDDDSAQPINSDTLVSLEADGESDIAAVIIAAHAPLGQQKRPSTSPGDYLEGGNGKNNKYLSGPLTGNFNDRLLVIKRGELMAAVEKRVAGEIRNCLERHADASANSAHRYPWPAPLVAGNFQGKTGSHFGRLPATQPASGPATALRENLVQLALAQTQLADAGDVRQQQAALDKLSDLLIQARNLFEVIFTMNNKLKQSADTATRQLQALTTSIGAATADSSLSAGESNALRALSESSDTTLDRLPELLGQFGVDVFPWELARRRATLVAAETPEELAAGSLAIGQLLAASSTPRQDIEPALIVSRNAASQTHNAAVAAIEKGGTSDLLAEAKSATARLLNSVDALAIAVEASRVSILAQDLAAYPILLETLRKQQEESPGSQHTAALLSGLNETRKVIGGITSGIGTIIRAKNAVLDTLSTTTRAAQSIPPDAADIDRAIALSIEQSNALVASIHANEAVDNNLSRTSLLANLGTHRAARASVGEIRSDTPLPGQSAIPAYAAVLGESAGHLELWSRSISANASLSAPLAKANLQAKDNDVGVLDTSAYAAAASALNSIEGKKGASETLRAYSDQPGNDNKTKATMAISETTDLLGKLGTRAAAVAEVLSGTTAKALPTVWNSARCDFLLPERSTWWNKNQWATTLFYQIGNTLKAAPASLRINNTGNYRLIALAAGGALKQQLRGTPSVANFLESLNADPSRDGDASAPSLLFSASAPNPGFNDRLAY